MRSGSRSRSAACARLDVERNRPEAAGRRGQVRDARGAAKPGDRHRRSPGHHVCRLGPAARRPVETAPAATRSSAFRIWPPVSSYLSQLLASLMAALPPGDLPGHAGIPAFGLRSARCYSLSRRIGICGGRGRSSRDIAPPRRPSRTRPKAAASHFTGPTWRRRKSKIHRGCPKAFSGSVGWPPWRPLSKPAARRATSSNLVPEVVAKIAEVYERARGSRNSRRSSKVS